MVGEGGGIEEMGGHGQKMGTPSYKIHEFRGRSVQRDDYG